MKYYIKISIILFTIISNGQTKREIKQALQNIKSLDEFEKYKSTNPDWKMEHIEINNPNIEFPKELRGIKKEAIKTIKIDNEKYYYKLISSSKETEYRVSYIYLNGKELTKTEVDSIRPVIIKKYKSGISFADLVEEYNMDGNSKKGDLGWFKKGIMAPDFEKAVIKHEKADIFTVDVDNSNNHRRHNWYYVVLKTFKDRISEIKTYVRIKEQ